MNTTLKSGKLSLISLCLMFLGFSFMACNEAETLLPNDSPEFRTAQTNAQLVSNQDDLKYQMREKRNFIVNLKGTDTGETRQVPNLAGDGGTMDANCFDVELYDLRTGNLIGTATDCLSQISPVGDGLKLIGTTYFNFNQGMLVSRGFTTVQPTTHGSAPATHITGAIPSLGDNDILYGTQAFHSATGPVRLSGAVNMSNIGNNEITFDCVFVIDLD